MGKIYKILLSTFGIIALGLALVMGLFFAGIIESPVLINIYDNSQYAQTVDNPTANQTDINQGQTDSQDSAQSNQNTTQNNSQTTSQNSYQNVNSVPSALNIKLTGKYLAAYENAVKNLANNDLYSKMIIKIGLQILQQNVIIYEDDYHYYSNSYSGAGNKKGAIYYNLENCIKLINNNSKIYTDCFGFTRLTYCIACYTINSKNPENVEGLNQMYGFKGSFGSGKTFNTLSSIKGGAMLYDTITGSGSTKDRHVAIFLYSSGNTVTYMDQSGIFTGTFTGSYIYAPNARTPYKFNKTKNFV